MDDLTDFVKMALKEPDKYLTRLLTTLEVNKVEAAYQKPNEVPIFEKRYDEFGLINFFAINPNYNGDLSRPKTSFAPEDYERIIEKFQNMDEAFFNKMCAMLLVGQTERELLSQLQYSLILDTAPLILKKIDEDGFPIAYSLNAIVEYEKKDETPHGRHYQSLGREKIEAIYDSHNLNPAERRLIDTYLAIADKNIAQCGEAVAKQKEIGCKDSDAETQRKIAHNRSLLPDDTVMLQEITMYKRIEKHKNPNVLKAFEDIHIETLVRANKPKQ